MNKGYTEVSCHHPVSGTTGQRSASTRVWSYSCSQVDFTYQEGSMFSQQPIQRAAARTTIQPQHNRVIVWVILGLYIPEHRHTGGGSIHIHQDLSCDCHLKQFWWCQMWVMFDQQTLPWHPRIRYRISQKHLYEKMYGTFYYYDSKKLSGYSSTDIHLEWVGYS